MLLSLFSGILYNVNLRNEYKLTIITQLPKLIIKIMHIVKVHSRVCAFLPVQIHEGSH